MKLSGNASKTKWEDRLNCDCGRPRDCLCGCCPVCCSCSGKHEPPVVDPLSDPPIGHTEEHVPMPKDNVQAWARAVLGNQNPPRSEI